MVSTEQDLFDRIVLELASKNKVEFWNLCHLGFMQDVIDTLETLKAKGLIELKDGYASLNEKGRKKFGMLKKFDIRKILKDFKKIKSGYKFKSIYEYDQLQLLPESVAAKLEFLWRSGDLIGRKIICIGDDDLFGIALALTKFPESITVLDIDKRITGFEERVSSKLGIEIKPVEHNLFFPVSGKLKNGFDVFITEPPNYLDALTLFASRGGECLKPNCVGYISFGKCAVPLNRYSELQQNVIRMGFVITDIAGNFEMYDKFDGINTKGKK